MARKREKASDDTYNARRREYRAAQRYLKKANATSGATASRNRALAQTHLQNALNTYDLTQNQKISSSIANLGAELGIDVYGYREDMRSDFVGSSGNVSAVYESRARRIEKESSRALESSLSDEDIRRDEEARAIMNNPSLGKRIIGGLSSVWSDSVKKGNSNAENRQAIQDSVFEYFGVQKWADVIDKLREMAGESLFEVSNDLEMYDTVKIAIEKGIAKNESLA